MNARGKGEALRPRINFMFKQKTATLTSKSILLALSVTIGLSLVLHHDSFLTAQSRTLPVAEGVMKNSPALAQENSIERNLESKVKGIPGVQSLETEKETHSLRVVLSSDDFFEVGSANLAKKSMEAIQQIANVLSVNMGMSGVEIEGHTDDSPVIKQKRLYRSNWELSLARAASLVHVFEEAGILKDKLKVIGYGDSRPLVPNRTPDGEAILKNLSQNRRIVLRVLTSEKREGQR